ncbi:MAG: aspartate dehydrogenase [Acidobacteria bacterium]|nr:aspartate dehydrogenase [Acidobacteriota bacterium]
MKLGLIGCGAIGSFLLQAVNHEKRVPDCRFTCLFDLEERGGHLASLAARYRCEYTTDFPTLLQSDVDLVLEAASPAAARQYAAAVLESNKHLLLMSVGVLVEKSFLSRLQSLCRQRRLQVCIPSGAIGGLDVIRAAMEDRVERVRLTTRKPPAALESPVGLPGDRPDLGNLKAPFTVFEGSAAEAIRLYPKNINVSIALSIAGPGPEATRVRIVADPTINSNVHEIEMHGSFGEMRLQLKNLPMADNPKTSFLAALSAIAALRRFDLFVTGGVTFA